MSHTNREHRAVRFVRDGREGFALALVVVVLMVASGVLLDGALRARIERRQAFNSFVALRSRAAAQAGISHGLARLRELQDRSQAGLGSDPDILRAWNRPEMLVADLHAVRLADASYLVELRDASSKLPLNDATEDEFARLFRALGANSRTAVIAAQSILDWRDSDDLHRPYGAEWENHYRYQPLQVMPTNGPFTSLGELERVRGLESLYRAAAEHLSIIGDSRVNLNTAPEPVLRALPGLSDEAVAWLLERQRLEEPVLSVMEMATNLTEPGRALLQREMSRLLLRTTFEPQLLEITSTGHMTGEALRHTIRAIAVRSGASVEIVRQWQQ